MKKPEADANMVSAVISITGSVQDSTEFVVDYDAVLPLDLIAAVKDQVGIDRHPSGVGEMHPGDTVEVTIAGPDPLRNTVIAL